MRAERLKHIGEFYPFGGPLALHMCLDGFILVKHIGGFYYFVGPLVLHMCLDGLSSAPWTPSCLHGLTLEPSCAITRPDRCTSARPPMEEIKATRNTCSWKQGDAA